MAERERAGLRGRVRRQAQTARVGEGAEDALVGLGMLVGHLGPLLLDTGIILHGLGGGQRLALFGARDGRGGAR